jgi:tetratricopeptide (TPR) repeat protein
MPVRRPMVPAFLVVIAVAWGSTVLAQDWRGKARVDGWVKDKNGQPIADATVQVSREKGGGTSAKTNKKGYWAILGLAGGAWNVDVSAPGFETRKVAVSLSEANRIPPMEILLEPAAAPVPAAGAASQAAQETKAAVEEGNRLLGEKKYAEARAQYQKALAAVPDNPALLKGIAQTFHGEGDRAKAVETLRKIQQLDPNDVENKVLLASLLLEDGKLEEGQGILDQLSPGSVKDPAIYVNLGILFMNKNNAPQAQSYFTRAIELDPSQADAYYYRGLSRLSAKKNADAKADFLKYLELAPNGPEAKEVKEMLQAIK